MATTGGGIQQINPTSDNKPNPGSTLVPVQKKTYDLDGEYSWLRGLFDKNYQRAYTERTVAKAAAAEAAEQAELEAAARTEQATRNAIKDLLLYDQLLEDKIRQLTTRCRMSLTVSHFKGGVGKTPFSCNFASELFVNGKRPTVVIDHNQMWGTAARQLGLKHAPCMTIRQALQLWNTGKLRQAGDFTSELATSRHGVALLASDRVTKRGERYGEETSVHNIRLAREHVQFVINDTGNDGESSAMKGVLDNTGVLVVPTSPDEDGIDIAQAVFDTYRGWGDESNNYVQLVDRSITVIMGIKPGEKIESYRSQLGLSDEQILLAIPYDQRAADRKETNLGETDFYVRLAYKETVCTALMVEHAHTNPEFAKQIRGLRTGQLLELPSGRAPALPWIDGSEPIAIEQKGV